MANFPPNGPYGGPFNYHGQYAPPPSHPPPPPNVPYNMMQPPPYLQQRTPMYNAPPQSGHIQYANAAAFHNNTQYPPQHGLQHNMSIAPPPLPQFFGYGQYGNNIPPPPFPPPPPPQAHNYHAQVSGPIHHVPSPVHVIPLATVPQRPSPSTTSSNKVSADMVHSRTNADPNKELVEVSKSSLEQPINEVHLSSRTSDRQDSPESGELATENGHDTNLRSLSSSVLGHPSMEEVAADSNTRSVVSSPAKEDKSPFEDGVNTSITVTSNNMESEQISHLQNGKRASLQNTASAQLADPKDLPNNEPSTKRSQSERSGTHNSDSKMSDKRSEKRELAKVALQQLRSNNIGREQLVAEGIKISVLSELYTEIGIVLPNITQLDAGTSILANDSPGILGSSDQITSLPESQLRPNTTEPPAQKIASKIDNTIGQGEETIEKLSQPLPSEKGSSPAATDRPALDARAEAQIKNKQSKKSIQIPPKKLTLNSAPNKALDRKDYIAKLLAAKEAVKHTPATPKTPKAPEARSEATPEPVTSMPTSTQAVGYIPASVSASVLKPAPMVLPALEPQPKPHIQPEPKHGSKADARPEQPAHQPTKKLNPLPETRHMPETRKPDIKDPVQTELVRKRLEALKRNTQLQPLPAKPPGQADLQASTPNAQQQKLEPSGMPVEKSLVDVPPAAASDSQAQSVETIVPTVSQYSPAKPFFASGDRKAFDGLPGLSFFPPPPQLLPPASTEVTKPISTDEESREASILSESSFRDMSDVQSTDAIDQPANPHTTAAPNNKQQVVVPVEPSILATETRKRATAADFIDSPPERTKRRQVSDGRIQLVIEVSDEEDLDDHDMQVDTKPVEEAPITSKQLNEHNNMGAKAFRDFPPLSNFPSRPATSSIMSTPPKNQTPKDLAQAEEEIRLVKQKIAELEQRKKSKIITSGVATTAPSRAESMPPASKSIEDRQQILEDISQELVARQNSLAAATSVMQETLESEKRTQAMVAAKAEDERKEAARAITEVERRLRLERKATLEAALPKLDSQIGAAKTRLDEMRKQQEEIESEIQRGNEGRVALIDELNILLKSLEWEASEATASEDLNEPSLSDHVDSDYANDKGEASTPRTNELEPSENNISGRSDTQPDLVILSDSNTDKRRPLQNDMLGDNMDISSSSADEGQIFSSSPSITPGPVLEEDITPPDDEDYEPLHYRETQSQEEYEPENFSPEPSPHPRQQQETDIKQVEMAIDSHEEYEPSLGEDISPPHKPPAPISIPSDTDDSVESFAPATELSVPSNQGKVELVQGGDSTETYRPHSSSMQEEGEVTEGSRSDPDDYEPPEPALPVDNDIAALEDERFLDRRSPSQDSEIMEIELGLDTPVEVLQHVSDEPDHGDDHEMQDSLQVNAAKFGHYTPYESPLARFTSYRFHPQYVSEVPGGFRSLTYSHRIDPRKPLCRRELEGGACNYSYCEYQHFRDLTLTDNNILLELGSVHEGTTKQEQQGYIDGLKQIISGMRDRNLKDVSAVASEIVAYRANFLGDASRVLTSI